MFEERLAHFWFQYQEADSESEAEARLAAIGQMLGYEYERIFKGSMAELSERFASAYVSSGLADTDDHRESEGGDTFTEAADILTRLCLGNDDLYEQDKVLAPSCLYAAASVARMLVEVGDTDGMSTEDRIAAIPGTRGQRVSWTSRVRSRLVLRLHLPRPRCQGDSPRRMALIHAAGSWPG